MFCENGGYEMKKIKENHLDDIQTWTKKRLIAEVKRLRNIMGESDLRAYELGVVDGINDYFDPIGEEQGEY